MTPSADPTAAAALLDAVREDPQLSPVEKETALRFSKDQDTAAVFSCEAGITRRLLAHPHAEIGGVTVACGTSRGEATPDEYDGGDIVGVRARVPVGLLKLRRTPRESSQHAPVVSKRAFPGGEQ